MSRAARLGAFIVAAATILAAGIFLIGGKQYLFTPTYRLQARFASVVGLDSGAEVRVGGVHSGSVRSVNLPGKPTDQITVWMDLDRSTHNIIKQDSIATIKTEGLLGNEYVAISFGSANGADVADGGTLDSEPPFEMSDLFKKTNGILDSSQEALGNVTHITANMSSIVTKIDKGQGTHRRVDQRQEHLCSAEPDHDSAEPDHERIARRCRHGSSRSDRLSGQHGGVEE